MLENGQRMADNDPISEHEERRKTPGALQSLVQAEKLLQVAFVLPSATVIGWLAGAWADQHWHQSWLAIAGIIFGAISGLVYVVRMAADAEKALGPQGRK
jgi:F0F1-type ATP synthase assembly protein I